MTGRQSRGKGNRFEVAVAKHLTSVLGVEVITTRNGRGGAQGGADLQSFDGGRWVPHVHGWAIECKDVAQRQVPGWLRQVSEEADVEWWCVIHKTRQKPLGQASVYMPRRMFLDYVTVCEPSGGPYDPSGDYITLTFDEWLEVCA